MAITIAIPTPDSGLAWTMLYTAGSNFNVVGHIQVFDVNNALIFDGTFPIQQNLDTGLSLTCSTGTTIKSATIVTSSNGAPYYPWIDAFGTFMPAGRNLPLQPPFSVVVPASACVPWMTGMSPTTIWPSVDGNSWMALENRDSQAHWIQCTLPVPKGRPGHPRHGVVGNVVFSNTNRQGMFLATLCWGGNPVGGSTGWPNCGPQMVTYGQGASIDLPGTDDPTGTNSLAMWVLLPATDVGTTRGSYDLLSYPHSSIESVSVSFFQE